MTSTERHLNRMAHTNCAAGASSFRLATPTGRSVRAAELHALADFYAQRGDAETAADYRAQAASIE